MTMTEIKVSEATQIQLDWLVARCEGLEPFTNTPYDGNSYTHGGRCFVQRYCTDWEQGGSIIKREGISWHCGNKSNWHAYAYGSHENISGTTPLIAAMGCCVISKLGEVVKVPKELL